MSNNRYLEIDSTYRDRTLWPLAGEFEIPISQTGSKSKTDALDPVSLGSPLTSWTGNRVDANTSGNILTTTVDTIGGTDNIAASTSNSVLIITAPAGDLQQTDGYYKSLIANNTTISELRRIETYEYLGTDSTGLNDRAQITVSPAFSDNLSLGDTITINDFTDTSNTSNPLFFVPDGQDALNAYINCLLYNETLNESRPVNDYGVVTHILTIDTSASAGGPVTGWLPTHNYSLRKEGPILVSTVGAAPTTNTIVITGGSTEDDIYNGDFLRIRAAVYGNAVTAPENESRRIVDYDGATQTATVSPPFSAAPSPGDIIEILGFSYDNLNPFTYTGSLVSQQEAVCYEIKLLSISLPNAPLAVGEGSRIAFYPYVYVELANISGANAGTKNIIYSNNPNASRMLFRCTIDDISNPISSSFIDLDGDDMVQTIKFKPNDNLRFSVRLPNGEIYNTIVEEHYSPSRPNPLGQISAIFSLRRL